MRKVSLLFEGWKYHADASDLYPERKDISRYMEAKTECHVLGPASRKYAEGLAWIDVQIPHDYIISQAPVSEANWETGHFLYHNAWYRKHFTLDAVDDGKRIALYFEGVATHAQVYVNGCLAGRNFCGYTPFELDITSFVFFGEDNVIAVYVDSSSSIEGWWYQGGGIYRDVWLIKSDLAHIARDGVFIHPEYEGGESWNVPIDVEIRNDDIKERSLRLVCRGLQPDGSEHFRVETTLTAPAYSTQFAHLSARVTCPLRWGSDSPTLYFVETTLYSGDAQIDSQVDRYGYRTFRFATDGFYLNDQRMTIKGVCGHQDYALMGKAMPKRVAQYRTDLYKEMGVNAVRCSHYPHTRALMDAYDEHGFVVMAETRWFSDEPEAMRQLETLIKLERNRTSVVLWSVGNEEPTHADARGKRIAQRMFARIRQLDPTRPLTTVVCHDPVNAPVNAYCDVLCMNYNLHLYDELHAKYPDKPFVAGELCATATTRGWYADNMVSRGRYSAYDHTSAVNFLAREETWKFLMARDWVTGGFQWDAVEHRGEGRWPRLSSVSGAIDLYLQRKDAFYQNQSHWAEKPMIHLLPHWNHSGAEGRNIRVWAYTNCEEAELFLNGESLGRRALNPYDHAEWNVSYAPGELVAVGYQKGVEVCRDAQETSGEPVALRLSVEAAGEFADGRDVVLLSCWCVDAQGRIVPNAEIMVHFDVNSLGELLGTGADNCDATPAYSPDRKMYAGRCAACVRVGRQAGVLSVIARADGLASAYADIPLK